jgi:hypothetical protein
MTIHFEAQHLAEALAIGPDLVGVPNNPEFLAVPRESPFSSYWISSI